MQYIPKPLPLSYGYDDVAIVPGDITVNPDLVDVSTSLGDLHLEIPILASAMDSVVSPAFAVNMSNIGGLAILNLDGLHTRYEDTDSVYEQIVELDKRSDVAEIQKIYSKPIREDLISRRIEDIKSDSISIGVSVVPANTKRFAPLAVEAGADCIVVQSTVTTARHFSRSLKGLIFSDMVKQINKPILVGNTVSYDVTKALMQEGVSGIMVGVGPGAACTSREVLGIGMPQISATIACAAARDSYLQETGKYIPIITDGGIRTSGEMCKSFVAGADMVMIGSPFAKTYEAPGKGFHWGMAAPHPSLPRGTLLSLGQTYSLEELLLGPSNKTNGSENLVGALRVCMGMIGARNIKEMHNAALIYAPTIKNEGKYYQLAGLGT